MPLSDTRSSKTNKTPQSATQAFRIQEAIAILRQGKSHPKWREAAWHLMENAAKDTQLLLEAQRDLLTASASESDNWKKMTVRAIFALSGLLLAGISIWIILARLASC